MATRHRLAQRDLALVATFLDQQGTGIDELYNEADHILRGASEALSRKRGDARDVPTKVVVMGANASGKSYFINEIAMHQIDQKHLATSKLLSDVERQEWRNFFPLVSSFMGGSLLSLYPARLRFSDLGFRAYFSRATKEVYDRRLSMPLKTLDDKVTPLNYSQAVLSLASLLGDDLAIRKTDSVSSLFDELYHTNQRLAQLEQVFQKFPFLSALVELVIEGPFESLRLLNIEIVEVRLFCFFYSFVFLILFFNLFCFNSLSGPRSGRQSIA